MNKQEFLDKLRKNLSGLSENDIEERLTFYSEMIDDRVEEGLTEDDAVEEIGSVDMIVSQITGDSVAPKDTAGVPKQKKRMKKWQIALLALSSIVWVPVMIAAVTTAVTLYAVLWPVIFSLWASFGALCGGVIGSIISGVIFIISGNTLPGIAMIGISLVCAGLAIFMFLGCKALTKGAVTITKKIIIRIKDFFSEKEDS